MSKYKSFDDWWDNYRYEPDVGCVKKLAEEAYNTAINKVIIEFFNEIQYQYSANIADEIISVVKNTMENSNLDN